MTRARRHWLILLYPPSWRERYGDEMDEMLRGRCGPGDAIDVIKAALVERIFHHRKTGADMMQASPPGIRVLVRKPSAVTPMIMSAAALGVVLVAAAIGAAKPQVDEDAGAHIWQLLMAGQLPFLGWFALRWLRSDFRAGIPILGLQFLAFGAALLPVWILGL